MMGKTHLVAGAAAGLAVAQWSGTTDPVSLALATTAGALAALLPDWVQVNIPEAGAKIKGLFGHRGLTHWLWTALAITWLTTRLTPSPIPWAVLAGWGSHLLLDLLSGGIPLLWPLSRITLARVRTGSRIDRIFGATALILLSVQVLTLIIQRI